MANINQQLGKVQPLFVGQNGSELYICHHQPFTNSSNDSPIIICPPIGHEYERCHRAIRQLALQLAKAGFHVFRFDYSGTGDSSGENSEASIAKWITDINRVIEFIKRRTGSHNIMTIGLRLGATLMNEAIKQRDDINAACLWSPISEGKLLLQEWTDLQHEHERSLAYPLQTEPVTEIMGYPLSQKLFKEISELKLSYQNSESPLDNLCLIHHEKGENLNKILEHLQLNPNSEQVQSSEGIEIWKQESMEAVVPFGVVSGVVSWAKKVIS